MTPPEIARAALAAVLPQFRLHPHHGHHGIPHWVRVWLNARELCERLLLDPTVPCWFAYLHDSQRENEGYDPGHGPRAVEFARALRDAGVIRLDNRDFMLLSAALAGHSDGRISAAATVAVCWDADRLDLLRVGVRPSPVLLCTDAARHPAQLARSNARALRVHVNRREP
jgi:uncharacterized protein